jgi:hypothetical protein
MSELAPWTTHTDPIPGFVGSLPADLREPMTRAVQAWLLRTPSPIPAGIPQMTSTSFSASPGSRPGSGR